MLATYETVIRRAFRDERVRLAFTLAFTRTGTPVSEFVIENRQVATSVAAALIAFFIGAVLVLATGRSPILAYQALRHDTVPPDFEPLTREMFAPVTQEESIQ